MTNNHSKGRAIALLPIAVFLLFFIGSGLITGDFYSMPAIVGFLIALIIAFLQNKKLSFVQKLRLASTGVGDENILTMCLIFLAAGAFSGAVRAAGGVESTVNLGLSILPGNMAVAGLFAIGCFISISMGTSVGTITALAPIAAGISDKTGFPMAICAGAVVCGSRHSSLTSGAAPIMARYSSKIGFWKRMQQALISIARTKGLKKASIPSLLSAAPKACAA